MAVVGDVLQGRYRIDAIIGQGGMGSVYRATHLELGVPLAVKEMALPAGLDAEAQLRQFRLEGSILLGLDHPGLPKVLDFFEHQGSYYLVMEFIEGRTLEQVLYAMRRLPDEATVVQWLRETCEVLRYLHTHDPPVIFRDLKPSNMMLGSDGHIRLIDFGIAKFATPDGGGTLTYVHGAGTPGFSPPEQYGAATDARSDIYALGATAYHLLTGQIPPRSVERASNIAQLVPIEETRPDVSVSLRNAIHHMLELDRERRPATIEEVQAALSGEAGHAAPMPVAPRPRGNDDPTLVEGVHDTIRAEDSQVVTHLKPPARMPKAAWIALAGLVVFLALPLVIPPPPPPPFLNRAATPPPASPQKAALPGPGTLAIRSRPAGGEIRIDGKPYGKVPATGRQIPLPAGEHVVRVSRPGYVPHEETVNVESGRLIALAVDLDASGRLKVKARPGSLVFVDGVLVGQAGPGPMLVDDIAPGAHTVSQKRGEVERQVKVRVQAGQVTMVPDLIPDAPLGPVVVRTTPTRTPTPMVTPTSIPTPRPAVTVEPPPVVAPPPMVAPPPAVAPPPPPPVTTEPTLSVLGTSIEPGRGIGGFTIGMSESDLLARMQPEHRETNQGSVFYLDNESNLGFGCTHGRLDGLHTDSERYRTAESFGVGSPISDIIGRWGEANYRDDLGEGKVKYSYRGVSFHCRPDGNVFLVEVFRAD